MGEWFIDAMLLDVVMTDEEAEFIPTPADVIGCIIGTKTI